MTVNRKKILVADDDVVIIKTLTMTLASAGYTVLSAADGGSALRVIREESPDLLLLDINFPATNPYVGAWNGFMILQLLAQLNMRGDKPFIMITGETGVGFEARAKAAGAAAFFRKPLDHARLLTAIRRELHEAGPQIKLETASYEDSIPAALIAAEG
jgi:CheY-like chemotaxis protein